MIKGYHLFVSFASFFTSLYRCYRADFGTCQSLARPNCYRLRSGAKHWSACFGDLRQRLSSA